MIGQDDLENLKSNLKHVEAQLQVLSWVLMSNPNKETCDACAEILGEWIPPLLSVNDTKALESES